MFSWALAPMSSSGILIKSDMNRMVILKAIREMAYSLRESNVDIELERVYDDIIGKCNSGIFYMEDKGWSE